MRRPTDPAVREVWDRLDLYRVRYDMAKDLESVESLERSITRRATREHALRRRVNQLMAELDDATSELGAIETEIQGAFAAGALLIEEIIDAVRERESEAWSPSPVLGFRVWGFGPSSGVHGARELWDRPSKTARCHNGTNQVDLPHRWGTCGMPSCGIYATKDLDTLRREMDRSSFGPIVGLVALTDKVIEHDLGYRARTATAVAVAGDLGNTWFATHDPDEIERLFAGPEQTIECIATRSEIDIASYLNHRKEVHATWTWEMRNELSR